MVRSSLSVIEQHLNIIIGDKVLKDGKRKATKNKYYYYKDEYYIIKLHPMGDVWMIADDSPTTRRLLRNHYFTVGHYGYAKTNIDKKTVPYHKLCTDYDDVPDHINRLVYDNRTANLRETGQHMNMRNKTTYSNNKSGKQGVSRSKYGKYDYWKVSIIDDEGKPVTKSYNIKTYGNRRAKNLAIKERKRLEVIYGYTGE